VIQRAGIVSRAGAFAVDAVILALSVRATVWILDHAARGLRRFAPPVDLGALVITIGPLLAAIYLVAFWSVLGQTPGKMLIGVKIVARGGAPIGVLRALVRLVGYVVSALPCYLGFLWILGPQRRGWHDRLADTEVVYVASRRRAVDQSRSRPRLAAPSLRERPAGDVS
jgi:uncharacterized RDD family membrane protein YckC